LIEGVTVSTEVATKESTLPAVIESAESQAFSLIQRKAVALSKSTLVPKEYQSNPANCIIAVDISERLKVPPLLVMQNLYIVHGKPGWSSQFLIAAVNSCGRYHSLKYQFFGERGSDDWGCYAHTIERATGEVIKGDEVTIGMAKKEGWYTKSGSKWPSMPGQMLRYRAATFFARAYAPELTMGLPMQDEIIDIGPEQPKITTFDALAGEVEADPLGG